MGGCPSGGRAGRRSVERRVLPQHSALELLQLRARVEPELLAEQDTALTVDGECFGLAVRAIQSQHQLSAQPLAQRVPGDERFEFRHQRLVASEREFSLHSLFDVTGAQLLQPLHVGTRERLELKVSKRSAVPERLRLPQLGGCELWFPRVERTLAVGRQPLEAGEVELIGCDPQHVAGCQGDEPDLAIAVASQRLAQPRQVGIQRVTGGRGRLFAPQHVNQAVPRDDLVSVEEQYGEQRALLPAPEPKPVAVRPNLERTENAEIHHPPFLAVLLRQASHGPRPATTASCLACDALRASCDTQE